MNKRTQHLLSFFLVAFFVFIAIGSGDDADENKNATSTTEESKTVESPKKSEKEEAISISAAELFKNYKEDIDKADSEYKGKFLTVEGVVNDINKDIDGKPYLTLKTDDRFGEVQCFFDKSATIESLKKGQTVKVNGKVLGMMFTVILKECKLVE